MENQYKKRVTEEINLIKDPVRKSILLKLNEDFNKYEDVIKTTYYSLINDWQTKSEIEKFQKRYVNDMNLEVFIKELYDRNVSRFYNYYIDTAYYVLGNEKDYEFLKTIEKYVINITLESLEEKLSEDRNFILNRNIRHERTQKYMIDTFYEIFREIDTNTSISRISSIYERYKIFNLRSESIVFDKVESFLCSYLEILKNRISIDSKNDVSKRFPDAKKANIKKQIKSFTLKNPDPNLSKLNEVIGLFYDNNIIDRKDSRSFKKAFSGVIVKDKVNFLSLVDLACFVNLLRFRFKILNIGNVNQQVVHCFTVAGKPIKITSFQEVGTDIRKIIKGDTPDNIPSNFDLIDKILNTAKFHC